MSSLMNHLAYYRKVVKFCMSIASLKKATHLFLADNSMYSNSFKYW
jgi:hypothetical protein